MRGRFEPGRVRAITIHLAAVSCVVKVQLCSQGQASGTPSLPVVSAATAHHDLMHAVYMRCNLTDSLAGAAGGTALLRRAPSLLLVVPGDLIDLCTAATILIRSTPGQTSNYSRMPSKGLVREALLAGFRAFPLKKCCTF